MPTQRNFERIGISIITFMLTSMLGIACGSLGTYRAPVRSMDSVTIKPAVAPGVAPSPQLAVNQIDAGHRRSSIDAKSFYISGLPRAAEPFAKVMAMDIEGHLVITTAASDGSFMITAVPPEFEVAPGSNLLLSQIVPRLGESSQIPVRISGY